MKKSQLRSNGIRGFCTCGGKISASYGIGTDLIVTLFLRTSISLHYPNTTLSILLLFYCLTYLLSSSLLEFFSHTKWRSIRDVTSAKRRRMGDLATVTMSLIGLRLRALRAQTLRRLTTRSCLISKTNQSNQEVSASSIT